MPQDNSKELWTEVHEYMQANAARFGIDPQTLQLAEGRGTAPDGLWVEADYGTLSIIDGEQWMVQDLQVLIGYPSHGQRPVAEAISRLERYLNVARFGAEIEKHFAGRAIWTKTLDREGCAKMLKERELCAYARKVEKACEPFLRSKMAVGSTVEEPSELPVPSGDYKISVVVRDSRQFYSVHVTHKGWVAKRITEPKWEKLPTAALA